MQNTIFEQVNNKELSLNPYIYVPAKKLHRRASNRCKKDLREHIWYNIIMPMYTDDFFITEIINRIIGAIGLRLGK